VHGTRLHSEAHSLWLWFRNAVQEWEPWLHRLQIPCTKFCACGAGLSCLSPGLVGETTNHGAHWPAVASASRVEFRALQAKRSIGCVGGHAIGLNSWTGTEGSPVSSLKCYRWQQLNLESHLIAVCATSGYWCSKPCGLCHGPQGHWLCAGRPACYRLTRRAPDGRAGAVRPTGQLPGLAQEKQSWYKAECTIKYSTRLSVNYISRTHTDTHTLRFAQWQPWHCG